MMHGKKEALALLKQATALIQSEPERQLIWVATVRNEYGVTVLASTTEEGMDAKLTEYVRTYWLQAYPEGSNDPTAEEGGPEWTDAQIVEAYFTSPRIENVESVEKDSVYLD